MGDGLWRKRVSCKDQIDCRTINCPGTAAVPAGLSPVTMKRNDSIISLMGC
jgi:hypothetical protein